MSGRVFEKYRAGARRLSIMRMAAMVDHGLRRLYHVFVVFAESTIAAEPSEAAFHYPCQTRNLETPLPSFGDFKFPTVVTHDLTSKFAAFMSSIGDDGAKSNVSARMWRLRPFTRLCPSKPRTPPRSVVLTDCPSMITTEGHTARPAFLRVCSSAACATDFECARADANHGDREYEFGLRCGQL